MPPSDVSLPSDVVLHRTSRSSTSADETHSPTMSDRLTNDAPTPSKRQRTSGDSSAILNNNKHDLPRHTANNHTYHLGYSAEIDPIIANEKLTKRYFELFMDFINIPTFEIFPVQHMLRWTYSANEKSACDRMVVYAMMALGTVHSTDSHRSSHRALFKSTVYTLLDQLETEYNLQIAHTLLFMGLAEFADADPRKSFNLFVRLVGCVHLLGLNIEYEGPTSVTAYDLSASMYAECRRRTFWATYATDIYAALSKGDPRIMHGADIFLRLPCASDLYDQDKIPKIAFFNQETVLVGVPSSEDLLKMADMVHLIQIATICSEVHHNAWRRRNALRTGQPQPHDSSMRRKLEGRLNDWAQTYNAALKARHSGPNNDDLWMGNKESGARAKRYGGLDILYHYAYMELNRRTYHKPLGREELFSYAKNANIHALETLKLVQQLLKLGGSDTRDYYFATRGPLGGYAVHTAIDILTAAGKAADILAPQSTIMTLMWGGCELLEHISAWWGTAYIQHQQAKERIQTVFNLCQAAVIDQKAYFYCLEPMETGRDREFDTIYGMDRAQYLRGAYGLSKVVENEIFVIDTNKRAKKVVVS